MQRMYKSVILLLVTIVLLLALGLRPSLYAAKSEEIADVPLQFVELLDQEGGLPTNVFRWDDYIAVGRNGLTVIYDISDPAHPVEISKINGFEAKANAGSYLYGPTKSVGTWSVWNLSQAASPINVNTFQPGGMFLAATETYLAFNNQSPFTNGPPVQIYLYDLASPASPVRVGTWQSSNPDNSIAWGTVAGDRLLVSSFYVACGHGSCDTVYLPLDIVDVSNPAQPITVGHGSEAVAFNNQTITADNFLYQINTNYYGGEQLFVSRFNGNDVIPVATVALAFMPKHLTVYQSYLYVAGAERTTIFDISTPDAPVEVATIIEVLSGPAYGTLLFGLPVPFTFESESGNGYVRLFDISAPTTPARITTLYHPGGDWAVQGSDNHLYLLDNPNGDLNAAASRWYLHMMDSSTPTHPSLVRSDVLTLTAQSQIYDVDIVQNQYLYITRPDDGGIDIFRLPTETNPPVLVNTLAMTHSYDSTITDNALIVATNYSGGGANVYDITNPEQPVFASHLSAQSTEFLLFVGEGEYAYMFVTWDTTNPRVSILDISQPAAPVEVGSLPFPSNYSGYISKAVRNGYLYFLVNQELTIADVHDPAHPTIITVTVPENVSSEPRLYLDNDHLYIFSRYCAFPLLTYTLMDSAAPLLHTSNEPDYGNDCENRDLIPQGDAFYILDDIHGIRTLGFVDAKTQFLPLLLQNQR